MFPTHIAKRVDYARTIGEPVVKVKKSMKQRRMFTANKIALIHSYEATAVIDIEGPDVRVKLDIGT